MKILSQKKVMSILIKYRKKAIYFETLNDTRSTINSIPLDRIHYAPQRNAAPIIFRDFLAPCNA